LPNLETTLNLCSLGMVGQAAISSHTLSDAMETIARYLSLRSPLPEGISFILSGMRELGSSQRFMVDAAFAASAKFLTQLADKKLDGLSFEYQHKMTGSKDKYIDALGPNVSFQQPRQKLFLPASLSKILLPTAHSISAEEARRYCDAEIKRLGIDHGFKQIVETLLRSSLTTPPTEKETARILGYSPRNFRRQLAEEGIVIY